MRSSGARSERSKSERITNTTMITTGMMSVRSRVEVVFVSRSVAVTPPTNASAPSTE